MRGTECDTLVVERLGRLHDRAGFRCGVDALDRWLSEGAGQAVRRNIARVFVACVPGSGEIAGYYALCATSVAVAGMPAAAAKNLPRHPVPCALLARLAVATSWQGKGLGELLLADAVVRVAGASEQVAMHAVVVDAKDARAVSFYRRYGFRELDAAGARLFLPVAEVRAPG